MWGGSMRKTFQPVTLLLYTAEDMNTPILIPVLVWFITAFTMSQYVSIRKYFTLEYQVVWLIPLIPLTMIITTTICDEQNHFNNTSHFAVCFYPRSNATMIKTERRLITPPSNNACKLTTRWNANTISSHSRMCAHPFIINTAIK